MWEEKPVRRTLLLVRSESVTLMVHLALCYLFLNTSTNHSGWLATTLLLYIEVRYLSLSVSGDAEQTHSAARASRRMYTVLPPPADYMTHSEKSFTLPHLENRNSAKDPSGKSTIILCLWSCAVHHKARRDLWHGVFSGLVVIALMHWSCYGNRQK